MAKEKETTPTVVTTNDAQPAPSQEISEVLARLRELEARDATREAEMHRLRQAQLDSADGEVVEAVRKPAETMKLASVEGMPVVDCKLQNVIKTDERGNKYNAGMEAHLTVHGMKDTFITSYGNLENPDDFLNLPRVNFQLTDQNEADLTGASKVEYNKIISKGEFVDEIDRSSGSPIKTGRKVQLVEKNDFRYYTILVGDEKVTLAQDKIYR